MRRWREDAVFFCGKISAQSVANFREILRPTDTTLFIASFGGDLDAPLELAELAQSRALHAIVLGPCLSGCASFVFVGAPRRTLAPGGVLGLHNTSSSALLLARASAELEQRDAPLEQRAAREQALYRAAHVNPDLLIEPQVRLETLCIDTGQREQRTGETQFLIHTRYGLWTPTRTQWTLFGVMFEGATPSSRDQAQRLVYAQMPAELRSGASVMFSRSDLPAPPQNYLAGVPRCAS